MKENSVWQEEKKYENKLKKERKKDQKEKRMRKIRKENKQREIIGDKERKKKERVEGLVLWHINHFRLSDAKSSLYIYIKYT